MSEVKNAAMKALRYSKRDPRLRCNERSPKLNACRHPGASWGWRMLAADKTKIDAERHGMKSSYNSLVHDHDQNPRCSWLLCKLCGFYTETLWTKPWVCWCAWPRAKPLDTVRESDAKSKS